MSSFTDYERYDATGLAQLIRNKEVSSTEVVEAAIERIERHNPELNAVITTLYDQALDQTRRGVPDGPLAGVPFLLKDLNTNCIGAPSTNGSYALRDLFPQRDSELVARYRRAGLVIIGKTNTPELGLNISTEPALFGPTRNPHDHSRSAGGSSGGSACAVASGMLPAAHATDSLGSIRIPASNCGLFGLKPSRARVPLGHDQSEGLAGLSAVHAVSHSVRDSALLLDISSGPVAGDPYCAPPSSQSFKNSVNEKLPAARIALWTEGFADEFISPQCREVAITTARRCEELGCYVEEVRPDLHGVALRDAIDVLVCANIRTVVTAILKQRDASDASPSFEPIVLECSEKGATYSASNYVAAAQLIHSTARSLGDFFGRYDFLLTPTLANPPLPLGVLDMQSDNWPRFITAMLNEIPFTPMYNATGCPAASVPMGRSAEGLPIGVQIGAALGREDSILRLSGALERGWPWRT